MWAERDWNTLNRNPINELSTSAQKQKVKVEGEVCVIHDTHTTCTVQLRTHPTVTQVTWSIELVALRSAKE